MKQRSDVSIYGEIKLYAGSGNPALAKKLADCLDQKLSGRKITEFPNENLLVQLADSARGQDVFVIQSTASPVHKNIMELLIMLQTLKLDSAGRITAVVPYMTYARSDKKDQPRVPITARLIADMIEVAGADRYMTFDLHAGQIQGFFSIPGDVLTAFHIITDYVEGIIDRMKDPVVVTADLGFAKKGRNFANDLGVPLALIEKRRSKRGDKTEALNLVGEVDGRDVILVDDEIDTAGSISQAVALLKKKGCREITLTCVHPVFSYPAVERLESLPVREIICTDTLPISDDDARRLSGKLTVLSIAPLLAEVIIRAHEGRSVGEMFNE